MAVVQIGAKWAILILVLIIILCVAPSWLRWVIGIALIILALFAVPWGDLGNCLAQTAKTRGDFVDYGAGEFRAPSSARYQGPNPFVYG